MGLLDPPGVSKAIVTASFSADAYIDFATKPNGDPPARLDTGQAVDFDWGASNWKPQISSGKLIRGTLPESGSYADYYQAQLDGDCIAAGTRYTVNSADGATEGIMCLSPWVGVYQGTGDNPGKTPAHITVNTVTNVASWFLGDGLGHLYAVKSWTFTPPAADGVAVWETAYRIDPDNGVGYLYLPGVDSVYSKRVVTITDAEINTFWTANHPAVPVPTLASALLGANVVMVEHFANANPATARFPRFLDMWAEVQRKPRDRGRALRSVVETPAQSAVQYNAATQQNKTIATTTTNITVDSGATQYATITTAAGPNGKIEFLITGATIEMLGGSVGRTVNDGAITAASATLTSATAAFTASDAGKQIIVLGAGASGVPHITTIASVTNSTTAVLTSAAATTVSGAEVRIGPSEAILYSKMVSGALTTTPNPDPIARIKAGDRWMGSYALVATGLTPGEIKTWTLTMAHYPLPLGTGNYGMLLKFGGAGTTAYPSLKIQATPL